MRDGGAIRRYLGFLAVVVGLSAVWVALAWWPAARLHGAAGRAALLWAAAVAALAAAAGGVPLARVAGAGPRAMVGFLVSMLVRLMVVVAAAVAVIAAGWVRPEPFAVWLALSYLLFLGAETGFALRLFRRL